MNEPKVQSIKLAVARDYRIILTDNIIDIVHIHFSE